MNVKDLVVKNLDGLMKSSCVFWNKNSRTILVTSAIAGTITTAVLAASATPKALDLIAEEKKKELDLDHKRAWYKTGLSYIKHVGPVYLPAIVTGGLTIAAILANNKIQVAKQAALYSALQLSQDTLVKYRDTVINKLGNKKEELVRSEANTKVMESTNTPTNIAVVDTKHGNILCRDGFSGRYFYSDPNYIKEVVNELNESIINGPSTYETLNSFYYELGLRGLPIGDDMGWDIGSGKLELYMDSELVPRNIIGLSGQPCLTLNYGVVRL